MATDGMRDYRKLDVWQLGRGLASSCYSVTGPFPNDERFGLTAQMRRAAVAIPSNIAEGVGRDSDAELLRFLRISLGSLNELETQLLIAMDLGFIKPSECNLIEQQCRDLGVKMRNLAYKLERDLNKNK